MQSETGESVENLNLKGTQEDDEIWGMAGNDRISGLAGNDIINGGAGNDYIVGGEGADALSGGDGDDRLIADADDTLIDGGDGFDRLIVRDSRGITLDQFAASIERAEGGDGDDVFDASGFDTKIDQVGGGGNDVLIAGDGGSGQRSGSGNDTLTGGDGSDRQRGDEGDDTLEGGAGDDRQDGGTGNDIINGGAGNDYIVGGEGADALSGGDGDDRLVADADDTLIDGGDGFDRLIVRDSRGITLDQFAASIERAEGGDGDDVFDASGFDTKIDQIGGGGNDVLIAGDGGSGQRGGSGNDTLTGGDGSDRQRGDEGDDTLEGGAGDDRQDGGTGNDIINGGAGNDYIVGGEGADIFTFGSDDGSDLIADFELGLDTIAFTSGSFEDVTIEDTRAGASIRFDNTTITTRGVSADGFTSDNFSFAEPESPFPEALGVVNAADFGIIADDGIDDTAAIQSMFDTFQTNVVYYFEDGVYNISDTLAPPNGVNVPVPNFITIQGESQEGTIFKLDDGLNHQGAILSYGSGVAQAFNNRILDVTFDTGTGNQDAIGLSFNGNNQSSIRDVTIRSGESGTIGLNLTTGETGPLLVEDVTIEGFSIGIDNRFQGNSTILENITLRGQDIGINNGFADGVFARQIDYEGPGTGLLNGNQSSRAVVVDSSFTSTSEAEDQTAIINTRFLYAENVETEGFNQAVDSQLLQNFGNGDLDVDFIEEYFGTGAGNSRRGGAFSLFDSPDTRIGLEFKETPEIELEADLTKWASPEDFGGIAGIDASAALQAAIDSGATTIYIPASDDRWVFDSEIIVRGNVERIIGTDAGRFAGDAKFRIADGASDTVIIEGVSAFGTGGRSTAFLHDSDRTLVLRDITSGRYEAVAEGPQGDVFFANFVGKSIQLHDQKAYARHVNIEGDNAANGFEAKVINDGAEFIVLGLKTENAGTVVKTINGGVSEVLGSWHNGPVDVTIPRFVTEDASLFAAGTTGATVATEFNLVEETRDGETRTGNTIVDAYSAYDASLIADRLILLDNDDADVSGSVATGRGPFGYLGLDFLFAEAGSDAEFSYTATAVESGTYEVSIRNVDLGPDQNPPVATEIDIDFGSSSEAFTLADFNMAESAEQFSSLGTVQVNEGDELFLSFAATSANGLVIADAVRFERIEAVETVNTPTDGTDDWIV